VEQPVFPVEHAHDEVVAPLSNDEHSLAFPALGAKASLFIPADRPVVVVDHPEIDTMELEVIEGVSENQNRRFSSESSSGELGAIHANGVTASAIIEGEVEAGRTDELLSVLDRPAARVTTLAVVPCPGAPRPRGAGVTRQSVDEPDLWITTDFPPLQCIG
jgi:hypothetical protein